jgi:uncharacterized protein YigE (DUF2233 family)
MVDLSDLLIQYVQGSIKEKTNEIAINLESNIKREAPYDQGRLRRSIRVDTRLFDGYGLVTGYWDEGLAPHGIFVLAGTRPHAIVSKKGPGSVLSTPFGIFRMVHHPGTKPNDFLGRGLEKTLEAYR